MPNPVIPFERFIGAGNEVKIDHLLGDRASKELLRQLGIYYEEKLEEWHPDVDIPHLLQTHELLAAWLTRISDKKTKNSWTYPTVKIAVEQAITHNIDSACLFFRSVPS